jgi:hypothetical protein
MSLAEFEAELARPVPWYKGFYLTLLGYFQGLKRSIATLKRIWQNRWLLKHFINFRPWDYAFLYELMGDAFGRMEAEFRENGSGVNSHKDAKSLQICKNACHRLAREDTSLDMYYTGRTTEQEKLFSKEHVQKMCDDSRIKDVLLAEMKRRGFWWD